jgi:hypothetical protein
MIKRKIHQTAMNIARKWGWEYKKPTLVMEGFELNGIVANATIVGF